MSASVQSLEANPIVPDPFTPYSVRLPVFEGPLDLLLHLIRLNEVEITDIPIARIGEQYLEYLALIRDLDLDVVGEYLVMAATLAWIKSRMLLPVEQTNEDGEEVDPRAELIARLLEYQRFKEVAAALGERDRLDRDVFAGRAPIAGSPAEFEREVEVGLFDLVEAYRRDLEARRDIRPLPHEIESEEITIRERMLEVMGILETRNSADFEALMQEGHGRRHSKSLLVATFLAILELARLSVIRVYQSLDSLGVPEGPIHLRRTAEAGDGSWVDRIADLM
jgi:segregation and condensation protein A